MSYFPIFADLTGKRCLIVGGGPVAERKLRVLSRHDVSVRVVAPRLCEAMDKLHGEGAFEYACRAYESSDLENQALVIAATDDPELNRNIAEQCKQQNILVNVVNSPAAGNFIFPSVIDRAPLQIALTSGGKSPILSRLLRWRLEALIPQVYGDLARLVQEYRDLVKQRIPTLTMRRRFWEGVLQGPTAELVFSAQQDRAKQSLEALLHNYAGGESPTGEVYLVGAGPGDPDLLTFRAMRLMQQADVVVYDRLVSKPILEMVRKGAERIYVGKQRNDHAVPQESINAMLVRLAKEGKRVLRLKGGDPFIFGRGGEEIETLIDDNVVFQVVPGITAASGCATYAGIPLTHRDHSQACIFVTGHLKDGTVNLNWKMLAHKNQTVVFYMGLHGISSICEQLISHGRDAQTPAALIQQGTTDNQRSIIGSLSTLPALVAKNEVSAPTLIIVGEVVSLNEKLSWFKTESEVR